MRERGYIDGQNFVVEVRVTDGTLDQLPRLVDELIALKIDLVVASAGAAAVAARNALTAVPVVFVAVYDPVELGVVPSLARPGANMTGLAVSSADLAGKRLELLKEIVPKLREVAVLSHPNNPANASQLKGAELAARALGLRLRPVPIDGPQDFDAAFKAARGTDGVLQVDSVLFTTHRARIVDLAMRSHLPGIHTLKEYAHAGGLMSYGPHFPDLYRRSATYVEKILKGAKPADLPVEQPTRFEFVINMKTARARALTIPPSLVLRADELIE